MPPARARKTQTPYSYAESSSSLDRSSGELVTAGASLAHRLGRGSGGLQPENRRCLNLKGFTFPWSTSSPLHPNSCQPFCRPLPFRSSSRKGRRGDGDNQAEGDNRYQGFHSHFLRCRLHHKSKHRKVALKLPPNVTRRLVAASFCRGPFCRCEAMISLVQIVFPNSPTHLKASASVGALFLGMNERASVA